MQRDLESLKRKITDGEIDPSFLITRKIKLENGPGTYKTV